MRILRLQTQGFKRVVAVDITPGDDAVVEVRGDNAHGKSSLLDSIKAALGGASVAPVKPVRTGEDFAAIRLELGDGGPDVIVTKYFDAVGEKLRVENADGAEFTKGQTTVDKLLGRMTFDPLAFARKDGKDQAAELLGLVNLGVDLDEMAKADAADRTARRDVNREAKALIARRDAIETSGIVPPVPDRDAITAALAGAGDTNAAIERERTRREELQRTITARNDRVGELVVERDQIEARLAAIADEIAMLKRGTEERAAELVSLPPLGEPVDTAKLSADLAQADKDLALLARIAEKAKLDGEVDVLRNRSAAYVGRLADRASKRATALKEAALPVPGLALARLCDVVEGEESEELIVLFNGEPFSQASSAEQLRVSMRLAMAANPRLRVMLIKDGSLLDQNGLSLVRELAREGDYQVWLESVGDGDGTGLVMEAGVVRGAPEPERLDGPRRRKAKAADDAPAEDKLSAQGVQHALSPDDADKLADFIADERAKDEPAAPPPPPRRKPSEMRKPAGDLFGGGE